MLELSIHPFKPTSSHEIADGRLGRPVNPEAGITFGYSRRAGEKDQSRHHYQRGEILLYVNQVPFTLMLKAVRRFLGDTAHAEFSNNRIGGTATGPSSFSFS